MADIRPLTEADLHEAKRLIRVAFGTFLGAPDPENFWADLVPGSLYCSWRSALPTASANVARLKGFIMRGSLVIPGPNLSAYPVTNSTLKVRRPSPEDAATREMRR
jgi:hypothetical protein